MATPSRFWNFLPSNTQPPKDQKKKKKNPQGTKPATIKDKIRFSPRISIFPNLDASVKCNQ